MCGDDGTSIIGQNALQLADNLLMGWNEAFESLGTRLIKAFTTPRGKQTRGQQMISDASGGFGGGLSTTWTQNRHAQVTHYRTWVYIAIRALAEHIAYELPDVATRRAAGSEPINKAMRLHRGLKSKALSSLRDNDEIELVPEEHPLRQLFANPNEPDTAFDLFYEHELFLGLCGISYWWLPKQETNMGRINLGKGDLPGEIWVIPSPWVVPHWSGKAWVDYYEIRPYGSGSRSFTIPGEEMVCFQQKHPWHKRDGWSPLSAADKWVDMSDTVDTLRLGGLLNSAFPSLAFEFDPAVKEPDGPEMERIMAKARARLIGPQNVGNPLWSRVGGKVKTLMGVSDAEIGFLESNPMIRDMVLSIYRVPYTAAGIVGGATHENYQESMRGFFQNVLNPKMRWYGQVLTEKVASLYSDDLIVYWRDRTPIDEAARNTRVTTLVAGRATTPNEIRMEFGMAPFEFGGDDPIDPASGLPIPWGTGKVDEVVHINTPEPDDDDLPKTRMVEKGNNGVNTPAWFNRIAGVHANGTR